MHSISEADMRAIVRLLGDAAVVPGGFLEKKRHVLDGVCDLAGANEWCWLVLDRPPSEPGARLRSGVRRPLGSVARPQPLPLDFPHAELAVSCPRAKDRLLFHRTLGEAGHSVIVLTKAAGQRAYSEREEVLSRLILDGIPWLHWPEPPEGWSEKSLPPRLRHVLDLLMVGLSRKEIAHRLGVSLGTVHGYARELYRFHEVNSQAELMRVGRAALLARK